MRVFLTVLAARDLMAKDANGLSDPFCFLSLCDSEGKFLPETTRYKTPTQYKTLLPDWTSNSPFVFDPIVNGEVCGIRIEVWDEDRLSSDEFLGFMIALPDEFYQEGKEISKWVALCPRPSREEKVTGDICICIRVTMNCD